MYSNLIIFFHKLNIKIANYVNEHAVCLRTNQVVICYRTLESVIDSESSKEKIEISSRGASLSARPYKWWLNMRTGQVKEKNLTVNTEISMDFPMISLDFVGLRNKFGYTQVVDYVSSSSSGDLY